MTNWNELLTRAVNDTSQAAVARKLGYSRSYISLALKGSKAHQTDTFTRRVVEVFGDERVDCPVLGDISMQRCVSERKKEFSTANPVRVELWDTCKNCENNPAQYID